MGKEAPAMPEETQPLMDRSASNELTHTSNAPEMLKRLHKQKSFKELSVVGADHEEQIVGYEQDKMNNMWVLLQPWCSGSIFRRTRIWQQIVLYYLATNVIGAIFYVCVTHPERINGEAASKLSTYFNMFLPFLFGIYLNNTFQRWWLMRAEGLGALSNALNDISLILASHCRAPEVQGVRKLVLRYGLLSHELIYRAARKTDGDLNDLVASGALKAEEYGILQELPGLATKSQAVWVWIQSLVDGLYHLRRIPPQVHYLLLEHVSQGRAGIKRIFTVLTTQMPFAYVHLMACLVHLNLLILAYQAGVVGAKAVGTIVHNNNNVSAKGSAATGSTSEACTTLVSQVVYLTMVPMLYLGFLELAQEISDPFGTDPNDFPRAHIHNVMQDECESIYKLADAAPFLKKPDEGVGAAEGTPDSGMAARSKMSSSKDGETKGDDAV